MTTMMSNGRARKSLASQIDRLDSVLDGLADGLQDAIAGAVQQAVSQVLHELLARPELLAQVQPQDPWTEISSSGKPTTEKKPGLGQRIMQAGRWLGGKLIAWRRSCDSILNTIAATCMDRWHAVCRSCNRRTQQLREAAVDRLYRGYRFIRNCGHIVKHVRRLVLPLTVALMIGAAAGVGSWWFGPSLASMIGGIGGFTTALATQLVLRPMKASVGPTIRSAA